jgi:hypothetical protein
MGGKRIGIGQKNYVLEKIAKNFFGRVDGGICKLCAFDKKDVQLTLG